MILHLMKNTSPNNSIGKVLTTESTLTINFKSSVDIVAPELILSSVVGVDYLDFNYCHIPDVGRYYFITSIESLNSKLWKLSLSCDVLETYKDEILLCDARLKRTIKVGDYAVTGVTYSENQVLSKHLSNVTLPDNGVEHTNILTVVEGGSLL